MHEKIGVPPKYVYRLLRNQSEQDKVHAYISPCMPTYVCVCMPWIGLPDVRGQTSSLDDQGRCFITLIDARPAGPPKMLVNTFQSHLWIGLGWSGVQKWAESRLGWSIVRWPGWF